MNKFIIGNRLTVFLLAVCAVLAAIFTLENREIILTQEKQSPPTQTDFKPPERQNFNAPNFATFREINERPLFLQSRRPPPKIIPKKPKPKPKPVVKLTPLNLNLEGIVISSAEKIGVFADSKSGEVHHFSVGDKHAGWELISVTDSTAIFERGKRRQELTLKE